MDKLLRKLHRRTTATQIKLYDLLQNETGAIDLASIMVGIIVIGLIGGIIAATIFTVIPWSQDAAAKQQLDSVASAESSFMGLSSSPGSSSPLPSGSPVNSYGNSTQLDSAGLLHAGTTYCVVVDSTGKNYTAFSQSSTGVVWSSTNQNPSPSVYTGNLPSSCYFITSSVAHSNNAGYVDPTPTLTTMTYNCPTTTTGSTEVFGTINGTETWSDGITNTYNNVTGSTVSRTLTAGVTYTYTFNGTYTMFSLSNFAPCLRSVDHWGTGTGVKNAAEAFHNATNLTSVPAHIPSTITNMNQMFRGDTSFNDPNVSQWDVSNVTDMSYMFYGSSFNQPLDKWDVSKATTFNSMFSYDTAFNQPLNSWNTSNVTDMSSMFWMATAINQPLNNWNTSKVTNMAMMFYQSYQFSQDLSGWNVNSVTNHGSFSDMSALTAAQLPKFLS